MSLALWGTKAGAACFCCGAARSRDDGARAALIEDRREGERLAVVSCERCRDTPGAALWIRWRVVHVDD